MLPHTSTQKVTVANIKHVKGCYRHVVPYVLCECINNYYSYW